MNGYMHTVLATRTQPHALTATVVQNQSPPTMFIQPIEQMAPVVQSFTPTPTVFPPEGITETHTTASYSQELTPELVKSDKGQWAFSLNIPIPEGMPYPILKSFEYIVKYGTGNGHGTSTVQTNVMLTRIREANSQSADVVISDADSPHISYGIVTDLPSKCNYRAGVGLPPQTFGDVPVVCLSSVPAVKENCHSNQWEYYVDRQQIFPHVRIIKASHMYIRVHIDETAPAFMLRSLVIDVSATWVEDMQGKAMYDKIKAAELRREIAEQKKAEEEQMRLQAERKSAEARQAKEMAEKKSAGDQQAKRQAGRQAGRQADAERLAKQQADVRAQKEREARAAIERQL